MKKTHYHLILNSDSGRCLLVLVITVMFLLGCSKSDDHGTYKLTGKWVCENHKEYQGELEFTASNYNLQISYEFLDSLTGSKNESGEYSYTSNYHDPDNLFSGGYYYGTITFHSGSKTSSVSYSFGNAESFAFVNYKIDPKITLPDMWWAIDNK